MDKIKIGIPRSLYFYYYGNFWKLFLEKLGFEIVLSPKTNKEIMNLGLKYSYDEMCLSLKNYIGHVAYLKGKCDYILIPRIDNFGYDNQTCTNFLATYDIINNLFDINILNYNVENTNNETEEKAIVNMVEKLGISKNKAKKTYKETKEEIKKIEHKLIKNNLKKLSSSKTKILIVGHPYNTRDEYIGNPIIKILNDMEVDVIYSDLFNKEIANAESKKISKTLYWKHNKEIIGCIPRLIKKIDGIIFFSTFPCGPDSLVNELAIRKIKIPTLNLIIDDIDSLTGFETRLESFIDVVKERSKNLAKAEN